MTFFRKEFSLDTIDLKEKLIGIFEEPEADGNFIINYFIWEALRDPSYSCCLLALKHNFDHYFKVGMKLGYNLVTQKDRSIVLDATDLEFTKTCNFNSEDELESLFLVLEETLNKLQKRFKSVFLIIDDLSYLKSLGFPVKSLLKFCHHLRTLKNENITMVLLSRYSDEISTTLGLKTFIEQYSDLKFYVTTLKTGTANDITGVIRMTRKLSTLEGTSSSLVKHYKLTNKAIRVFSPGSI